MSQLDPFIYFAHKRARPLLLCIGFILAGFLFFLSDMGFDRIGKQMRGVHAEYTTLDAMLRTHFDFGPVILAGCDPDIKTEEYTRLKQALCSLEGVQRAVASVTPYDLRTPELLIVLEADYDEITLQRIEALKTIHPSLVHLSGAPLLEYHIGLSSENEPRLFTLLTFLIIVVLILFFHRNIRALAFVLLCAGFSLCSTLSIYHLFSADLTIISSLLPPMILALSLCFSVHVLGQMRMSQNIQSLARHLSSIMIPCSMVCLTTVVGFLSLCFFSIPAVQVFAITASIGALIVAVTPFVLAPVFYHQSLFRQKEHDELTEVVINEVHYEKKTLLIASLLGSFLSAILIFSWPHIPRGTDLSTILVQDHPLIQDQQYFDSQGGSAGLNVVLEKVIPAPGEQGEDWEKEEYLDEIRSVLLSGLPFSWVSQGLTSESSPESAVFVLRSTWLGSEELLQTTTLVRSRLRAVIPPSAKISFHGDMYRIASDSQRMVTELLLSATICCICIGLLVAFYSGSFILAMATLATNLIPITLIVVVMALAAIPLDTPTAMIASIILGLAVDDTVHVIYLIKTKKRNMGTLRALLLTTLSLSFGFGVCMLGTFEPIAHFGLLCSIGLMSAYLSDRFLLPHLIGESLHIKKRKHK